MKYVVGQTPCFDRHAKRRAELAKRVAGIDIWKKAVDAGNAKIARRGIANVRLSAQNAGAMDSADGTLDFVCGLGILHHFDDAKAMAELRRALKRGGAVHRAAGP